MRPEVSLHILRKSYCLDGLREELRGNSMLEITVAIGFTVGIIAIARGRGASPWLAGVLAVLGFVCMRMLPSLLVRTPDSAMLASVFGSWAWLLILAGFYRFRVGAGRPQPKGIWVCPNCTYTNKAYALACRACKQPWKPADVG